MSSLSNGTLSVFSSMFSLLRSDPVQSSNLILPDLFSPDLALEPSLENPKKPAKVQNGRSTKDPKKRITACPHVNKKHYAKNMCNNCYHRVGRRKTAWDCPHLERQLYAKGKCQFCYLQSYHKSRYCNVK